MPTVEVDEQTLNSLEFAAYMAGETPGQIVARLVQKASVPGRAPEEQELTDLQPDWVKVYADYAGHRTQGRYDRITKRIDITSGPLAGQSFKSPTGAARAVVGHYKPEVNSNRNGWAFWMLEETGGVIQDIRWS